MNKIALRLDEDMEDSGLHQDLPSVVNPTIDITTLVEYSKRIKEIGNGFNKMTAPILIRDFSMAYSITSELMYEATKKDIRASNNLELAESIAYLENAGAYLASKDIKDTAEARKKYVPLDKEVRKAAEEKEETAAKLAFLRCKLQEFKMAIESVKKIAWGESFMTPDE